MDGTLPLEGTAPKEGDCQIKASSCHGFDLADRELGAMLGWAVSLLVGYDVYDI